MHVCCRPSTLRVTTSVKEHELTPDLHSSIASGSLFLLQHLKPLDQGVIVRHRTRGGEPLQSVADWEMMMMIDDDS